MQPQANKVLDCSPKGDQPGFVEVAEDGRTLFIPDRRGINRIDGLKNLIEDPRIGLIFFVPGANETYRVNGRICQDAELKRRFAVNGKEPATVMHVTVEEAFQRCAKALVRSALWKAGSNGRPQSVPTMGDFVAARNPGMDSAAFKIQRRHPPRALLSEHSCKWPWLVARVTRGRQYPLWVKSRHVRCKTSPTQRRVR